MDFNTIIHDLLDKGYTFEDIAKNFTTELNRVETVNKSKEERRNYLNLMAEEAYDDCNCDKVTFATVGKVAVLAAAAKYPAMSLEKLKDYEKATTAAAEATAKFNVDLGEGKDPVDSFLNALFDDLPTREKKKTDKTDDDVIAKFVRALG